MRNDLLVGVPGRSREADDVGACVEVDDLGEFEVGGGSTSEGKNEEGEKEGSKEDESEERWNGPVKPVHERGKWEDEDEEGGSVDEEDIAWELVAEPPILHDHEYDEERELGGNRHNQRNHFRGVELRSHLLELFFSAMDTMLIWYMYIMIVLWELN